MSSEMEVGFAWKSSYTPWKVELLLCKAAGIYKDPFNPVKAGHEIQFSTYELDKAHNSNNISHTFTSIEIVTLKPGIYHFVFRVYRSEESESDIRTSEFYSTTRLASGREVNYIEVMSLNHNKPGNLSSLSTRNDSSYYTANESLSESCKTPLLDYYDDDEEQKCHVCCTIL